METTILAGDDLVARMQSIDIKIDGFVKSRKVLFSVIPAKAGHVVKL
ncbi:MAG: hypothetical protein U9Q38_08640 [Thermodesulfobacteriota bacterium]|nr:hypothetical protein [Thermodesulfobacteriota bacterium]